MIHYPKGENMKDAKNFQKYASLAGTKLTYTEFKVFIAWFDDREDFSAGANILCGRLPAIARQNIARALKGIEYKGFIVKNGFHANKKGKSTPLYVLNESILNESIESHNESIDNPKCINPDTIMNQSDTHNVSPVIHVPSNVPLKVPLNVPVHEQNSPNSSFVEKGKQPTELNQDAIDSVKMKIIQNILMVKSVLHNHPERKKSHIQVQCNYFMATLQSGHQLQAADLDLLIKFNKQSQAVNLFTSSDRQLSPFGMPLRKDIEIDLLEDIDDPNWTPPSYEPSLWQSKSFNDKRIHNG